MRRVLMMSAAAALTACQSEPQLATLSDASPETLDVLSRALVLATGRARVNLGAGDVTQSPEVTVLPPPATPLEGNSPALPTVFEIVLLDGDCHVRERGSAEVFLLEGVSCEPFEPAP